MNKINSEALLKYGSILLVICSLLSHIYASFTWVFLIGILFLQIVLFTHADVFIHQEKGSPKWKTYRFLCYVTVCIYVAFIGMMLLDQDETKQMDHTSILICFLMIIFGNYAPKIPYNRTLGLRLPWTLQHEATWKYAHRILGWCSFPCALIYIIGLVGGIHELCFLSLCLWFLIPTIASYHYDHTRRSHSL